MDAHLFCERNGGAKFLDTFLHEAGAVFDRVAGDL